jgi:DNA-binding CsgD family transcriptional regulator
MRPAPPLPLRQKQVLRMLARGLTTEAMARAMHVQPATAKMHRSKLYASLGASGEANAVALAYECGLLCPGELDDVVPWPV